MILESILKAIQGLRVAHLEAASADAQDVTLLFAGFETLCRQPELVRFDWEDFSLSIWSTPKSTRTVRASF